MIKCVVVVPTFHSHLVNQMINQNYVSICAVVTDNRIIAVEQGIPKGILYAFWQFREVLEKHQPDYVLMLTIPNDESSTLFKKEARNINFPTNRIVMLTDFITYDDIFDLGKRFETYEKNPDKYRIFATGASLAQFGIRAECFELPLINFSFSSQDFYYDYQIAQKILNKVVPPPYRHTDIFKIDVTVSEENLKPHEKRSATNFKYALLGLAPYRLHYDQSKSKITTYLTRYFYTLHDMHNFPLSYEELTKIFKPSFLAKLNEDFKSYVVKFKEDLEFAARPISYYFALQALKDIDHWDNRYYPATVEENKKILDDYLTLLEKFHIQPIFFLTPMIKEYCDRFNKKMLQELFDYLNELYRRNDFIFVNGWAMNGFDDYDFWDIRHLNVTGAKKFSAKINQIVMQLEGKSS